MVIDIFLNPSSYGFYHVNQGVFASIPPSSKALFKATSSALENNQLQIYSFLYNRFRKL
jgi:hypothetical protein